MKYKWIQKDVDLEKITGGIEDFLKSKKFKTHRNDDKGQHRILGIYRTPEGSFRKVIATVSGTPESFTVELEAGEQTSAILKLGSLISLFGGGGFIVKGHEAADFYRKIEDEFWRFAQTIVSELKGSATSFS